LIAQRYSPYLKTYYEKMKARRVAGKAIVALARKVPGNHLPDAQEQLGLPRLPQLCIGGGNDGMTTAAYASATLSMASLRLRRLIGRWRRGKPKPEA
jgi:hypothetical protein